MPSPAGPFKLAQEAALRGSAALATAAGAALRIYTEVPVAGPSGVPLPYLVTGQDQIILEADGDCADEAEIFASVGLWSRTDPLDKGAQCRAMGSAAIDALNVALSIDGWEVVVWELVSERYVTDPDQSTHGILDFRYLLTEQVLESEGE